MHNKAKLVIEDGTIFEGFTFGFEKSTSGELVFNTAMTGYPESLTDPSYKGQLLVATYPLIGNYGVPHQSHSQQMLEFYESEVIQVSALIISEYSTEFNHWNAEKSLDAWLKQYQIPGLYGIDTRLLTQILREKGSLLGKIIVENQDIEFYNPNVVNLVQQVSISEKQVYGNGLYKILLIDCGVKNNIIRHLLSRDTTVIRVPWDYDYSEEDYDGLFISNGPGDPQQCEATIQHLSNSITQNQPIFGICLGHQLMALAQGSKTYKLKYGHRSHNQPVQQVETKRAYITSQNHGYAVDDATLPKDWFPLFINLNDHTNEGLKHVSKPFFSTQFHPEASGGPTDTEFLFDDFIDAVKKYKSQN
jgi:carbamoyl-phosphate synthase small subunit